MLAAVAGAAFAAMLVTCGVMWGWTDKLDHRLLAAVRPRSLLTASGKRRRLTTAAMDISMFGGDTFRIVCIAGCLALLGATGQWRQAWTIIATIVVARIALFGIKHAVRRPRPDPTGHGVEIYTKSFPSGHTFMTMASLLAIALVTTSGAGWGLRVSAISFSVLIATLVGAARLFLGVHWPSDVIVGWLAGFAWAFAAAALAAVT